MKAIMVMFDSLNRHMLPPYGCDWVQAPNFQRLAARTVRFDNAYVGSMPCMPARRELHTGRYNFLHRSWGPLEPFDDSMPQLLREAGIATHLVTDHYHYFEDGGATYHHRYSNWRFARGQEGDAWYGDLKDPHIPMPNPRRRKRQDWVNRAHMREEQDYPQARTMAMGMEFLDANHDCDNWFLQIETFDPHEPWFVPQHYQDFYPDDYQGPEIDWPPYAPVREDEEHLIPHMRRRNAALVSMCDHYLGQVMDKMDAHGLWDDTLLIVNTDHGYLIGEHGWWAKCKMPFYNEIAHIPLFIWDPRTRVQDESRQSLVQTIDLPATILEYFGVPRPEAMQGKPLRQTILHDTPVRETAIFGIHGGHVNITDGRYVYMRAPADPQNQPLYEYSLMSTCHGTGFYPLQQCRDLQIVGPFAWTKGCQVVRFPSRCKFTDAHAFGTKLFDLQTDPNQQTPLDRPMLEARLIGQLKRDMEAGDAPPEQYARLGLT